MRVLGRFHKIRNLKSEIPENWDHNHSITCWKGILDLRGSLSIKCTAISGVVWTERIWIQVQPEKKSTVNAWKDLVSKNNPPPRPISDFICGSFAVWDWAPNPRLPRGKKLKSEVCNTTFRQKVIGRSSPPVRKEYYSPKKPPKQSWISSCRILWNRPKTHSTPEGRLATFLLFLIFGTAERTPFAQKSYVRKNPSGIILHLLRVEFCNSQEVQNYSRNPAVF